jgi:predicted acetyltransferase
MRITIDPAALDERATLVNLLQLYFYDFSEIIEDDDGEVDGRGRFPDYRYLDAYFDDPDRFPFLFRVDGRLAGCALVRRLAGPGDEPSWSMAEFFVLRRYRRRGVGRAAARDLFDRFPGRWEVGELHANTAAIRFWRRVIGEYTGGRYSEEGADDPATEGPLQIFRSPGHRY